MQLYRKHLLGILVILTFFEQSASSMDKFEKHAPAHQHRAETFHYSPSVERKMTELTKLEEQAETLAKQEQISDQTIEKALNSRRIIIQTRADLVNVEFHIT